MKNKTPIASTQKRGPIEIKKAPAAVHPILHDIIIKKYDGSIVHAQSSVKKDLQCNLNFDQHSAWLPARATVARTTTSTRAEGLFE